MSDWNERAPLYVPTVVGIRCSKCGEHLRTMDVRWLLRPKGFWHGYPRCGPVEPVHAPNDRTSEAMEGYGCPYPGAMQDDPFG